jgi:hypothetical protein
LHEFTRSTDEPRRSARRVTSWWWVCAVRDTHTHTHTLTPCAAMPFPLLPPSFISRQPQGCRRGSHGGEHASKDPLPHLFGPEEELGRRRLRLRFPPGLRWAWGEGRGWPHIGQEVRASLPRAMAGLGCTGGEGWGPPLVGSDLTESADSPRRVWGC